LAGFFIFFKGNMMRKLYLVLGLLAALLTFTSTAFAQIGSADKDLVYTPVTPCRLIDTRLATLGAISAGAGGIRGFFGANSAGFAGQGGSATNCGITTGLDTAAVAVNFTVVSPAAAGYITVFPYLDAQPLASTLNYTAGAVVGNSATVKLSNVGFTAMAIYSSATTHVVADVVGYYSKPVATALQCIDTDYANTLINGGPSSSLYFAFVAPLACPLGYTSISLRCFTNNAISSASESTGNQCSGNSPVNTSTLYASRTCCRIPGR
jgi:hypothetical protein